MARLGDLRMIFIGVAILLFGVSSFNTPIDLTDSPWASALLSVAGVLVIASVPLDRRRRRGTRPSTD